MDGTEIVWLAGRSLLDSAVFWRERLALDADIPSMLIS
jgi:hypothetical protein